MAHVNYNIAIKLIFIIFSIILMANKQGDNEAINQNHSDYQEAKQKLQA